MVSQPLRPSFAPAAPPVVSRLRPASSPACTPRRTSPPAASAGTATGGSVGTSGGWSLVVIFESLPIQSLPPSPGIEFVRICLAFGRQDVVNDALPILDILYDLSILVTHRPFSVRQSVSVLAGPEFLLRQYVAARSKSLEYPP